MIIVESWGSTAVAAAAAAAPPPPPAPPAAADHAEAVLSLTFTSASATVAEQQGQYTMISNMHFGSRYIFRFVFRECTLTVSAAAAACR